jgi:predicted helicase
LLPLQPDKGHCLLEMPSGTGKTITILSLAVAYQMACWRYAFLSPSIAQQ